MRKVYALFVAAVLFMGLPFKIPTGQGTKEKIEKMHQDPKAYIAMLGKSTA